MSLYRPGSVPQRIMERAEALPAATPICAKALLDLGSRAAVDQALSRLVRQERLDRIYPGIYMRTIMTRYGPVSPDVDAAVRNLSEMWGEVIVPSGGAAANFLGLTTQLPIQTVYWTSGPTRRLHFGRLVVKLLRVARWKLVAPDRRSGMAVRALAFFGRYQVEHTVTEVASRLTGSDRAEFLALRAVMPSWMAEPVSAVPGSA